MYKYIIRRLLLAVPVLVLSSLIVFGLMRVMPGDALTALMAESGNVSPRSCRSSARTCGSTCRITSSICIWVWQMVTFNPGAPSSPASRSRSP